MATKTLKIKETAWQALTAHKRSGETYSDVILRLAEDNEAHCTKHKKASEV
jgi:predicted CopG family antitoxin